MVERSLRRALGLHQLVPAQLPAARAIPAGLRTLFARLLLDALADAQVDERRRGLRRDGAHPASAAGRWQRVATARQWLRGELDDKVPVPVETACAAVDLEPAALHARIPPAPPAPVLRGPERCLTHSTGSPTDCGIGGQARDANRCRRVSQQITTQHRSA